MSSFSSDVDFYLDLDFIWIWIADLFYTNPITGRLEDRLALPLFYLFSTFHLIVDCYVINVDLRVQIPRLLLLWKRWDQMAVP